MSALRINIRFDQEGGLTAKSPLCDLTNPKYHDFRGHYMLLPRPLENHPIWAKDKTSVGHLNRTPYSPTFKPNTISHFQKHYPLTEEKLQGISPLIEEYKKEGILKEIVSPWNTFFFFLVYRLGRTHKGSLVLFGAGSIGHGSHKNLLTAQQPSLWY